MNWRKWGSLLLLIAAIVAGVSLQIHLVQTGHWDFVRGYIAGVIVYQFLVDPQWVRRITEPDEFVSLMMWVFFPFVATLATMWRIMMENLERR